MRLRQRASSVHWELGARLRNSVSRDGGFLALRGRKQFR